MTEHVLIAFRAYLTPMFSTRGVRLGFFLGIGALLIMGIAYSLGRMVPDLFEGMLRSILKVAIVPGVPLAAILAGEMPIRDAVRQRTLLYHLLGPVPRPTLAVVRTLMTALLVAGGCLALMIVLRVTAREPLAPLGREALAILLGSVAYTGLFGLLHLVSSRGLIGGLAFFFLLDHPLGQLPFALREFSPSYHLRVLADTVIQMELPVFIEPPVSSLVFSALVLAGIALATIAATAILFRRKNLGELC